MNAPVVMKHSRCYLVDAMLSESETDTLIRTQAAQDFARSFDVVVPQSSIRIQKSEPPLDSDEAWPDGTWAYRASIKLADGVRVIA